MAGSKQSDTYSVDFGFAGTPGGVGRRVLMRPSRDNWNDFGFKTHVNLEIVGPTGEVSEATGFLGFLADSGKDATDTTYLRDLLSSVNRDFISAEDIPARFFTMLSAMDGYRELVDALGPTEVRNCLLALNDVVALAEFRSSSQWLSEALVSAKVQHVLHSVIGCVLHV